MRPVARRAPSVVQQIQEGRTGLGGQPDHLFPTRNLVPREGVLFSKPLPEGGIPRPGYEGQVRPADPATAFRGDKTFGTPRAPVVAYPKGIFSKPQSPRLEMVDKLGP